MTEFLTQHPIYVVLTIALAVWIGIIMYLFRIDGRLRQLEQRSQK